jgi:predicted FMN-binding regulatory protein PaiB
MTPTPWEYQQVHKEGYFKIIRDDGEDVYKIANGLSHEDAEFIVRACNAHDDLVKALQELYNQGFDLGDSYYRDENERVLKQAEAALAKAGKS